MIKNTHSIRVKTEFSNESEYFKGLFGVPSSSQEPPSAVSAASATSAPHHPVVQALLANAHSNQQSPNPIFANILQSAFLFLSSKYISFSILLSLENSNLLF